MTLSQRLQHFKARSGLTYEELGKLAGLPGPHVHKVVTGQIANPSHLTLGKVAEAMGVTLAELFAIEEDAGTR